MLVALLNSNPRRSARDLERLYQNVATQKEFQSQLRSCFSAVDEDALWQVTWLVVRLARDGKASESLVAPTLELGECSQDWRVRLHVCQFFACLKCSDAQLDAFLDMIERCMTERWATIRAWALTALVRQKPAEGVEEVLNRFLKVARVDGSPAVQARLRLLGYS